MESRKMVQMNEVYVLKISHIISFNKYVLSIYFVQASCTDTSTPQTPPILLIIIKKEKYKCNELENNPRTVKMIKNTGKVKRMQWLADDMSSGQLGVSRLETQDTKQHPIL